MGRLNIPISTDRINSILSAFFKRESDDSLAVSVQDQTSEIVNYYFTRSLNENVTLTAIPSIGSYTFTVSGPTLFAPGLALNVCGGGRTYQGIVVSKAGNDITTSTPNDYAFPIGSNACPCQWQMNQDGSETPLIFCIKPPPGVKWDICRLNFGIYDDVVMDDAKFGGIAPLSSGIIIQICNGYKKILHTIVNNVGFVEQGFATKYSDKAPAGKYGYSGNKSYNGQEHHGVAIRLDGDEGDGLLVIIQDDLTDLDNLTFFAQGHKVI